MSEEQAAGVDELPFDVAEAPTTGWDPVTHSITDLRGADWAARKLREAQEQMVQNLAMVQPELEALRLKEKAVWERLEKADAPFKKTAAFMENALRVFAETHRDEVLKGLRTKSRLLPSGVRIGWEKKRDGYFWDDSMKESERKAKLLEWATARTGPAAPLTKPGPPVVDLDAVKKFAAWMRSEAENNGEMHQPPPGLKYVAPGQEELFVSTGVEAKSEES